MIALPSKILSLWPAGEYEAAERVLSKLRNKQEPIAIFVVISGFK